MMKVSRIVTALVIALSLLSLAGCASYKITGKNKKKKKETVETGKKVQDPGNNIVFEINVNPLQPTVKQAVTFNGSCSIESQNGKLLWNYGDGQVGEGFQLSHPYSAVGSYKIEATCQVAGLDPVTKSETVNVVAGSGNPGQNNGGAGGCGCRCDCATNGGQYYYY